MELAAQSKCGDAMRLFPVTTRVAYAWSGETGKSFYKWISATIRKSTDKLMARQAKLKLPKVAFRLGRMRAMHGGELLQVLLERIRETDILIFDISEQNPNVLIELGMALAMKPSGVVFVFQRVDDRGEPAPATPSDLSGYFLTRYQWAKSKLGGIQLTDHRGFTSALEARMLDAQGARGVQCYVPGGQDDETC